MTESSAPKEKRAGRNNNKPRSRVNKGRQTAYVSEPEHSSNVGVPITEPPKTPQKTNARHQTPGSQNKNQNLNQSRPQLKQPKNRSRSKNLQTSPLPQNSQAARTRSTSVRQTTPPQSAGLSRSTSTPFAGSTFHASPAPSSLPMPKFLIKKPTTPEAELSQSMSDKSEPSPPSKNLNQATPSRPSVSSGPLSNSGFAYDSPLEFIFQADRAEKQRAKYTSPQTTDSENKHLEQPHTVPRMAPRRPTNSPPSDSPALLSAIFNSVQSSPSVNKVLRSNGGGNLPRNYYQAMASEMDDGYAHQPVGSSFARPFSERLKEIQSPPRADPSQKTHSAPTQAVMHTPPPLPQHVLPTPPRASMHTPPHSGSQKISDDASAALKAYLFNIPTPETPSVTNINPMKRNGDFSHSPPVHQPNGFHRGYNRHQNQHEMHQDYQRGLEPGFHANLQQKSMPNAYPTMASESLALEDRLRQMLKISPSGSA
ncbi:hypothetical protein CFIMG_003130RA [Ceratocystis fimbriata CBS 114723]|uniref:Proteophosphoglycan 5 n=1 Tax=Ceratocystis fimbriata CBS 114723 TaxID=1035309 RepID=A0A2C5X020_9PEZI|nr:hypothetical protein CFIMG_003130RA [Ceratocystis fimbriata CBS 114723]